MILENAFRGGVSDLVGAMLVVSVITRVKKKQKCLQNVLFAFGLSQFLQ